MCRNRYLASLLLLVVATLASSPLGGSEDTKSLDEALFQSLDDDLFRDLDPVPTGVLKSVRTKRKRTMLIISGNVTWVVKILGRAAAKTRWEDCPDNATRNDETH